MQTLDPPVDVSGAVVGQTVPVSFVNLIEQTPLQDTEPAHALFQNESGVGMEVVLTSSGRKFYLAAGQWFPVALSPLDTAFSYTPIYLLSGAQASKLLFTYYGPGETVEAGTLGNSPLNGGSVTTNASAANAFEQDFLTPFVLPTGYVPTKNGGIVNELDVTAGIAFLRQPDNSLGRVANGANSFFTHIINTTYFLDLNPDGSWSFGTSHSTVSNYMTIATVTTDPLGNIVTVTDNRITSANVFPGYTPSMVFGGNLVAQGSLSYLHSINLGPASLGPAYANISIDTSLHFFNLWAPTPAGVPYSLDLHPWNGISNPAALHLDGATGKATFLSAIANVSNQATAGSFGVPLIVAQLLRQHVTSTALATLLTYAVTTSGLYRVSGYITLNNGGANPALRASVGATDPDTSYSLANSFYTTQLPVSGGSADAPIQLDGTPTWSGTNTMILLAPLVVAAKAGTNILCNYQDPSGTPSDFVSFVIERLG